ncbi:beta-2-microglobulin [Nothoprocta perdicaria]|uniref:Beta-2-microglobulin n=1 Tax=Nothoprocta perdicaria TaxID=30464 RepID=A0A8C7EBT9_NOTPE|nr:beta-2-microglobulin [Nothoprocta perdicaria]
MEPVRQALLVLLVAVVGLQAATHAPKVQVYSRHPVTFGAENVLNCYAEDFHPPKIHMTLLQDDKPMPNVQYSDMSFSDNWTFRRLAYAAFVPAKGSVYTCRVEHVALPEPQTFKWDPDF